MSWPKYRKRLVLAGLLCAAVTGCGSSKPASVTSPPFTGTLPATPSTTASAPVATTVPTTVVPTTAPATTALASVVGLVLTASGNTFTAPASATTRPYSATCQSLVDVGFYGSCVVVTGPSGTAAAVVERQQQNYQAGQPITQGQERDLVYVRVGDTWSLRLRRTPVAAGEAVSEAASSDIMRDGDPKAVFVEPAANSQFGNELDVIEANGTVTLYRQLHGGFATVAPSGGLDTYVPNASSGYDYAAISYSGGAWKVVTDSHVSASQAQAETSQAFYDPKGSTAVG